MSTVIIILDKDGKYSTVYVDSEIGVKILQRGKDDTKIDQVESTLEEIEV